MQHTNRMFILGISILCAFILLSCKKDNTEEVIITEPAPMPTGYTQYGSPMSNVPLTSDIIMYEVNLRAFSDGGDIQGVIDKLDHLQSLHINVIWLMPIYPVGTVNAINSPYCIKDYKAVAAEYGNLTKMRELTTAAHERGMAVIIDWVANHTAWDHPWINAHPEWYTQDANGTIIHPAGTNWTDVADLNYDNHDMRAAMLDAMKFWVLEANVDGFRCDHADGVPFDFWQNTIDSLNSTPNRNLIWLAEGERADHFDAGFHMAYSWDFYTSLDNVFNGTSAAALVTTNATEYAAMPAGKRLLRFTTNHDETAWNATPMALFNGVNGALAASSIAIFTNGVPLIYTGQEVGSTVNTPFFSNSTIAWSANPSMKAAYQSMLSFYSSSPAARSGALTTYASTNVFCIKKSLNGEEVLLFTNVRNTAQNFTLPSALANTTWINALTNEQVVLGTSIDLAAFQYLILKL